MSYLAYVFIDEINYLLFLTGYEERWGVRGRGRKYLRGRSRDYQPYIVA